MAKKSELKDNIHSMLSIYESYIKNRNKSGYFDINKDCEHIFCEFLNALYDFELVNLNGILKSNFPAIDLGDEKNEICVQVTSEIEVKKIQKTIESFMHNKLDNIYSDLWILILGKKRDYRSMLPASVKVKDFGDLSKEVSNCDSKNKLEALQEILHEEMSDLQLIESKSLLKNRKRPEPKLRTTYNRYLKFYGWEKSEKQRCAEDIKYFSELLSKLTEELREVIVACCEKRIVDKHSFRDCIYFNPQMVGDYLGDTQKVFNRLLQLKQVGYLFDNEDGTFYLSFRDQEDDYCILEAVVDFCQEYSINVEKIIIDLDFRDLD